MNSHFGGRSGSSNLRVGYSRFRPKADIASRINPDEPQTRILLLAGNLGGVGSEDDDFQEYGYDRQYGMGGDASMYGMAH